LTTRRPSSMPSWHSYRVCRPWLQLACSGWQGCCCWLPAVLHCCTSSCNCCFVKTQDHLGREWHQTNRNTDPCRRWQAGGTGCPEKLRMFFVCCDFPCRTFLMRGRLAWLICVSSLRTVSSPSSVCRCCTSLGQEGPRPQGAGQVSNIASVHTHTHTFASWLRPPFPLLGKACPMGLCSCQAQALEGMHMHYQWRSLLWGHMGWAVFCARDLILFGGAGFKFISGGCCTCGGVALLWAGRWTLASYT